MCGVTGVIDLNDEGISPSLLQSMTDAISHRGPDGEGHWIEANVGLGHRRLSILDLGPAGHQPMLSADERFVLSYNGEIYNFRELRSTLHSLGYRFRSSSDSEVVLNAFAEWGTDAFLKFNGMFALAIWDRKERKLVLGRDRYGVKPLYYGMQSKRFYFASEQKAITADSRFRDELNKPALLEYFTFQNLFTNQTLIQDVRLLPAGHFGVLDAGSGLWSLTQYWDFRFSESYGVKDEKEYEEELLRLFSQAVSRQLVSDVEVGSYLSGGLDSGSISAIASRQISNLKTFTVGFDLSSAAGLELGFDERALAESMSSKFKTEHYQMVLKSGDMERCIPQLVHHLEEPRVGQSYPNFYAAKLASKFVKVVLSGIGGDELFGGYPWRYFKAAESKNFEEYIDSYYSYWQRLASNTELRKLFAPIWEDVKDVWTRDIFRDVFLSHDIELERPEDYVNHSLYFEAKTFLQGVLVVEDKLSMAHGLETRVPFLDNDLVDFAMKCPVGLKLDIFGKMQRPDENSIIQKRSFEHAHSSSGKQLLRNSLRPLLGDTVSDGKKRGFSSPDESWFKGESIDFVQKHLNRGSLPDSVFDPRTVMGILEDHVSGSRNRRLILWSFIHVSHSLQSP